MPFNLQSSKSQQSSRPPKMQKRSGFSTIVWCKNWSVRVFLSLSGVTTCNGIVPKVMLRREGPRPQEDDFEAHNLVELGFRSLVDDFALHFDFYQPAYIWNSVGRSYFGFWHCNVFILSPSLTKE